MRKLISCFVILYSTLSFAQDLRSYSGAMKMSEDLFYMYKPNWFFNGEGKYYYYIGDDGKRVKHGDYYFVNDEEKNIPKGSTDWRDYVQSLLVKGRFENGKKEGTWTVNYEDIVYTINFKDDQFDGNFTARSRLDPSMLARCQFKDNHFVGNYYAEGDWIISGQFDDEGYADGTWTLTCRTKRPDSYFYCFTHGAFVKAYEYDDSTGDNKGLQEGNRMVVSENSIFGPSLLIDYDNIYYIRDYLHNPAFRNALPSFKGIIDGKIVRSDNHDSFNVVEYEQKKAREDAGKRENNKKATEELNRFKAAHPYVLYNGNLVQDIVDMIRPNLPEYKKKGGLLKGSDEIITLYFTVSKDGLVRKIVGTESYAKSSDRCQLIVKEAEKAIKALNRNDKWEKGFEDNEYMVVMKYISKTGDVEPLRFFASKKKYF